MVLSHTNSSGSRYSRSSRFADANSVMIRWPGSIVVPWMVNGLRTVRANHLTEDEMVDWLAALNDARLVLGVRLAVTEESTGADFAHDTETAAAFELYRYLSYLEEHVVQALGG